MSKVAGVFVSMILMCIHAPWACAELPLPSASFLKELDWKKPKAIEAFTRAWVKSQSESWTTKRGETITRLKEKLFKFKNFSMMIGIHYSNTYDAFSLGYFEDVGGNDNFKVTETFCSDLAEELITKYGPATRHYDYTRLNPRGSLEIKSQWDIERSRVDFSCTVFKYLGTYLPPIFWVTIGAKARIKERVAKVFLSCTATKKGLVGLADKGITKGKPIQIVLDIDAGNIRVQGRLFSSDEISTFNDRIISASKEDKKKLMRQEIWIDRYTGAYNWKITETTGKHLRRGSGYEFWGDCSPMDMKKKF